ncbi:unnamed protein product [Rhodiola kirilowii]
MEIHMAGNGGDTKFSEAKMRDLGNGEGPMFLVWEDVNVIVPNGSSSKRLLSGLSGFAEPGRIMAIMGPSGSGKSTLLDALSGRLASNIIMSGNVLLNGKRKKLDYGGVAYVTQQDSLLGTLSVRETLTYSANLRFPPSMTKHDIDAIIDTTIKEMGLQKCADQMIGNWHLRGISGGEKKRLSIALETLTRPSLLFLDEPTSGLDSASAFFVVQTLRRISRQGKTVISSIHQPSSEVFALFDDLFLLSGGETVYFGEASSAIEFFEEAGFPCPSRRNPSDHFLRCINSDFDDVDVEEAADPQDMMATAQIKAILVEKYNVSSYIEKTAARIQEISNMEGLVTKPRLGSNATWWKQLRTLTKRSLVNMSRDLGYYWLRTALYVTLSICVGTIFFQMGTDYKAIFARGACGAFISGFMTFMAIGGFPSFLEELKVFYMERLNGHYAVGVYILSNFISSFPFLVGMSVATILITYNMVKLQSGLSRISYACLDLIFSISVVESLMMIIASLVPNFLMGLVISAGVLGLMVMTAGFFRSLADMPKPFWRYPISYINFETWALQGAYKNDMTGLEFDPMFPGEPKLKDEYVLKNILGIETGHSKWWDLAAIILILIICRLMFYSILKLKERSMPKVHDYFARRTLKHLDNEKFIRKQTTNKLVLSERHQMITHPLSSQEGLNSPMQ